MTAKWDWKPDESGMNDYGHIVDSNGKVILSVSDDGQLQCSEDDAKRLVSAASIQLALTWIVKSWNNCDLGATKDSQEVKDHIRAIMFFAECVLRELPELKFKWQTPGLGDAIKNYTKNKPPSEGEETGDRG